MFFSTSVQTKTATLLIMATYFYVFSCIIVLKSNIDLDHLAVCLSQTFASVHACHRQGQRCFHSEAPKSSMQPKTTPLTCCHCWIKSPESNKSLARCCTAASQSTQPCFLPQQASLQPPRPKKQPKPPQQQEPSLNCDPPRCCHPICPQRHDPPMRPQQCILFV